MGVIIIGFGLFFDEERRKPCIVAPDSNRKPAYAVGYNGIPIDFQFWNGESWEIKEEFKNKKWNKETKEWE